MSTFHATKSALRVIQLFPCLSVWFREKLVQVINEVYSMIVRWVQNSVLGAELSVFPKRKEDCKTLGRSKRQTDRQIATPCM